MSITHWARDLTGSFTNPANWTGGAVPGLQDDAYVDASGVNPYSVVLQASEAINSLHIASNATVRVEGVGVSLTTENGFRPGGYENSNAGVMLIGDGAMIKVVDGYFGGGMNNSGTIELEGSTHLTQLLAGKDGLKLKGGGVVHLGGAVNGLGGTNFINVDNTISGAGGIGSNELENDAAGVVDANASGALLIYSKSVVNDGLLEATGTGQLKINNIKITQTGGGTISAAGGTVFLRNDDVIGGSITSTGTGKVVVESANLDLSNKAPVTLAGHILVADGGGLLIGSGIFSNIGTITLGSNTHETSLIVKPSMTLTGGGTVALSDRATNRIIEYSAAVTLTNLDNTITGAGTIGDHYGLAFNNQGVVIANRTTGLIIDTGADAVINSGQIKSSGAGGLAIDSSVTNSGTIISTGTGGLLINSSVTNSGQITSTSKSQLTIEGAVANTGTLVVNGGNLTVTGAVTGAGQALVSHGTLSLGAGSSENVKFDGVAGVLALSQSQAYGGTVSGFPGTGADALDLLDIAFGATTKAGYSGTTSGGTLTVTDGTHTAAIKFAGNYVNRVFTLSSDGHGGTSIVDPPAAATAARFVQAAAGMAGPPGGAAASADHRALAPPILATPRGSSVQ